VNFVLFSKEWWADTLAGISFGMLYGWVLAEIAIALFGAGQILVAIPMLILLLFTVNPLWNAIKVRLPLWPYN
jgi:hypothetical protein